MDDMPEDPHEDYLDDYAEWLADEPGYWDVDEDYLEDHDDWIHDEPEQDDVWSVEDYAD